MIADLLFHAQRHQVARGRGGEMAFIRRSEVPGSIIADSVDPLALKSCGVHLSTNFLSKVLGKDGEMEGELKEGPYWVSKHGVHIGWYTPDCEFPWRLDGTDVRYRVTAVMPLEPIPTRDELRELREKAGIASFPVEKVHELLEALSNTVNVEKKYAHATLTQISDEAAKLLHELTNPRKATP